MNGFHDPTRQESFLQQCLSHDKRTTAFLIGAGAPMAIKDPTTGSCLIPDIEQLTSKVCSDLATHATLAGGFKEICSHFVDLGVTKPTVEQMLSYIRDIHKIVGNGSINGLNLSSLNELDKEICQIINGAVNKCLPDTKSPYHKIASWINAIPRTSPVEIFTTNYDLLMEQALEDLHIPYFDGFSGSRLTFFDISSIEDDKLPTQWARIWKLHGSVNWFIDKNKHIYRGIKPYADDDIKIIHPSDKKYEESRKMPYLAMIDRLSRFIKTSSSLLLTCGYSFRDEHINDIIIQGLQSNPISIVFGMLYGSINNYPEAIKLAQNCSNFSLFAQDEAVIGTQRYPWIESDSPHENSSAISWVSDPVTGKPRARFELGNFDKLGDFFGEIIGSYNEGDAK